MIHYVAEELGYSAIGHNGILVMERQILLRNLHPQVQSINDFELYGVICHFLLEISREIDVDIQSDNLLVESLISHVKGMNNWNDADYDWDIGYETSGSSRVSGSLRRISSAYWRSTSNTALHPR